MARFSAKIEVSNDTKEPRIVWLEPWAEDYTLLPKEVLLILARSESEQPWFHVVIGEKHTQVYSEAGDMAEVFQNGISLSCGHKREEAIKAGIYR
jgi:hypothetical protein